MEIPVQLSPGAFINLLSAPEKEHQPLLITNPEMDKVRELIGLSAKVRLPLFNREAQWNGVFRRTGESMDISTGAITVYIEVSDPYKKVIPGVRPPLIPNMYTEVELTGKSKESRKVIPFSAIHDGELYIVDAQNRLVKKRVEVESIIGNMAVIAQGLEEKSMVVTTDLVPAIEGMLLVPKFDEQMMKKIAAMDATK